MSIEKRAGNGHKLSETQKERLWIREQISQIPELRQTMDNIYQNLAVLARKAGISPEEMVKEVRNTAPNYSFLIGCVKEEQRLNEEAQKQAEEQATKPLTDEQTNAKEENNDGGSASA